jgi:hypothetical protein
MNNPVEFLALQSPEGEMFAHFCGYEHSPWPSYTPNPVILYNQVLFQASQGRKYILELGSGPQGVSGTIFKYCAQRMNGHVWSIDKVDFKRQSDKDMTFIIGDTLEVPWNKHVDLLYVDAGHDDKRVAQELLKFSPWVWRGGVILMDDLRHQTQDGADFDGKPTKLQIVFDRFCEVYGLTWDYLAPMPNKIGMVKVTKPIPSNEIQYIDWNDVKPDNSK